MMAHLERIECGNLYFAFRWLLILFKREFGLSDVPLVWEVIWSGHGTRKFHTFVAMAILSLHRHKIAEIVGFDGMLAFVNSLANTLDACQVLRTARRLLAYIQQQAASEDGIPSKVARLLHPVPVPKPPTKVESVPWEEDDTGTHLNSGRTSHKSTPTIAPRCLSTESGAWTVLAE